MFKYISILIFFVSVNCVSQKRYFFEENSNVNLYAFVGKKISIQEFDPNANKVERTEIDSVTGEKIVWKSISMDAAFKCKYLVIENVFNDLKTDTIEFVAYDHYGRPGFENYESVLLYISKTKDGKSYFQQKYQYDPIFVKNGKIFGYFTFRTKNDLEINSKLKTFKIDLGKIDIVDVSSYNEYMLKTYVPEPFYKIENGKAKPILGADLKTLFISKQKTSLKELFQN